MADDVSLQFENALNSIVNSTDKSGNLKKELRQEIHTTVSSLRKLVRSLTSELLDRKQENQKLCMEVKQLKDTLDKERSTTSARQVATSINDNVTLANSWTTTLAAPIGGKKKVLYSEIVGRKNEERHKLTLKPKQHQTTEEIKQLLKTQIDPVNIQVGIRSLKSLRNGNVLIEADTKEEIEILNSQIREKCGDHIEANIQKRRNPRLIIYNIPDALTTENAESIISTQNPSLDLQAGDIQPKYIFTTKRKTRNLVIEVLPQTRRQILQTKLKLHWTICTVDDHISVTRCFKCSGYNHRHSDCKSEEACPLCAGKHRMQECTTPRTHHRCANCMKFNSRNKDKKNPENHSALDQSCPSLQAMVEKHRQNTNY